VAIQPPFFICRSLPQHGLQPSSLSEAQISVAVSKQIKDSYLPTHLHSQPQVCYHPQLGPIQTCAGTFTMPQFLQRWLHSQAFGKSKCLTRVFSLNAVKRGVTYRSNTNLILMIVWLIVSSGRFARMNVLSVSVLLSKAEAVLSVAGSIVSYGLSLA